MLECWIVSHYKFVFPEKVVVATFIVRMYSLVLH